ncbi:HlyD family type I secretion periplasmic adaptor subunit [Phenylobacterium montanum]|uniref:Membrane fusion protein (MFP) family protein n=1 Tax=Phenylobacterium montanum TaxID=2823693 RepID=A0A975FZD6_9CAUL|nr:HlyD family type I secretion periplasmic adaptor subunit [Caulobacter sp. S6]QUD88288.1 HlyD family type I secretion periplasmic adaptor subunit [Caulobacter sp. S6]
MADGFGGYLRRASSYFDRNDEREFLPAALEIVETPPSPTGRLLGFIIIAFFGVAVAWSFFGRVDVLATAPGRLIPAGDVKVIQPLDPGVVRAIHVQDGDHVRAGQLLIELDPTQAGADSRRLSGDLIQAELDVARLSALKTAAETGRAPVFVAPADAPPERVEEARAAMRAQADQQAAKLADLGQQISQKDAEAAEVGAEIDKINAQIPMLADKERIHRELTDQGFGTSLAYLDAQQQLAEARHELAVERQKAAQAAAARAALIQQRDGARSQYAAELLTDLRKAEEQQNESGQELIKARDKSSQTELRAPIDGVVDQLAVHTLHGVVTPAQHLMIVVPESRNLMIEAQLANRDVGFVHAGQPVKVKIETFNFTRYGLINGHVVGVSKDVITPPDEARQSQQGASGAAAPTAQPPSPTYVARIQLDRTSMMIDGREEPLQPGMAITAEIRTGDRSIIDYLLSPLARRTQESLHER